MKRLIIGTIIALSLVSCKTTPPKPESKLALTEEECRQLGEKYVCIQVYNVTPGYTTPFGGVMSSQDGKQVAAFFVKDDAPDGGSSPDGGQTP